jgi:hypothetical protein
MTAGSSNTKAGSASDSQELELLRLYRLMTRDQQMAVVGMLINMVPSASGATLGERVAL